jgi:hypothetical protein
MRKNLFDKVFVSMTQHWDKNLRDSCMNEYEELSRECESFENIFKSVIENKDLQHLVQNEINKRLDS